MSSQIVIKNCKLSTFRNMFKTKREYVQFISEMSLKERIMDWKPTNELEANLKEDIETRALIRFGASGVRTTSHLVKEENDSVVVYISYGGKRMRATRAGRDEDFGGYFITTRQGNDLSVTVKASREYHKTRYIVFMIIGLIFFIIPGVLIGLTYVLRNWMDHKKINSIIIPTVLRTFES